MSKMEITEFVDIRLNLQNYQHIEIAKSFKCEIEFSTNEERITKEDEFAKIAMENILRAIRNLPEVISGKVSVQVLEEAIKSKCPEWLSKGMIPNLMDSSRKKEIQFEADQNAKKTTTKVIKDEILEDKATKKDTAKSLVEVSPIAVLHEALLTASATAPIVVGVKALAKDDADLFDDTDNVSVSPTPKTIVSKDEDDDFFNV